MLLKVLLLPIRLPIVMVAAALSEIADTIVGYAMWEHYTREGKGGQPLT